MRFYIFIILLFLPFHAALTASERITIVDTKGRELFGTAEALNGQILSFRRDSDRQIFKITLDKLNSESRDSVTEIFNKSASPAHSALTPDSSIILEFPDLGNIANNQPAKCEIHIPKNYAAGRVFPLLVWFNGGKGSHTVGAATGIVDFDNFIVAAIPYPEGRLPRLGVENGSIDDFWEFQQPILEAIQVKVPNISKNVRIAGGFSSGGHLVGSAIDQKWKGFTDYFTAFILHEGGTSPDMAYKGLRSKHKVLVTYGEKSPSLEWQKYFNEKMKAASSRADFIGIPDCKHSLNDDTRTAMNQWIETELLPELER